MFDVVGEFNWLAIILATLAYYILGAVWFTPLFGKAWDKSIGYERSNKEKWPPIYYITPLVSSFVVTLATSFLIHALSIQSLTNAVALGVIAGLGYAASISVNNAVTPKVPYPLRHGSITGAYHVIGIIVVSVILFSLN